MSSHARNRIIYIHGFDFEAKGYLMPELEKLVRQTLPNTNNPAWVEHWSPLKDTRNNSFKEVAEQLAEEIRDGGAYERQYAVCHSMGGLIARQLCLLPGVHLDGILTISSPHEGTADWVDLGSWWLGRGPQSLMQGSSDLRELNQLDYAFHRKYHFVGVQCYGLSGVYFGLNDNDTVVERASQQGVNLGDDINRYNLIANYGNNLVPQGPSGDKLCPHNFVIDHAIDTVLGHISFDKAQLELAIQNCIKL